MSKDVIDEVVDKLMKKFDLDGNGVLEKNEFKVFLQTTLSQHGDAKQMSNSEFESMFKEFDKNNDNTICKLELRAFIAQLFKDSLENVNSK